MRVLVAIDQTDFWRQVVDGVGKGAFPPYTEFKILTVLEFPPFDWADQNHVEWKKLAQDMMNRSRAQAHRVLAEARERLLLSTKDGTIHTELREGKPREEIINAAVDWMPQKMFLGAHRQAPNRLFSGAVATPVARKADCTVELVRLVEPAMDVQISRNQTQAIAQH